MSSSKSSKRTLTVEKTVQDSGTAKSKPSVFERLGAPHSYGSSERQEICHDFANSGTCSYGSKCKYAHVKRDRDREKDRGSEHTERDRDKERASDDLRSRVSRKRDENESERESKKSLSQRKDKDSKIKSTVVVTKSSDNVDDIWPESFDADKGGQEVKGTHHHGSSVHGTESESHKWSAKSTNRSDKNEEGLGQPSSSSKTKNKSPRSPSHNDDDSSRRISKDKKSKKKRRKSQEAPSPDRIDDKQDLKHQKDVSVSSKVSSHKHSKSSSEVKVKETSSSSVGLGVEKKSKTHDNKDDNSKSVEKRLLMIAMEPEVRQDSGRTSRTKSPAVRSKRDSSPMSKGRDIRKEYSSPSSKPSDARKDRVELSPPPSKSRKPAREQSVSPVQSKENRKDRSISPLMSRDRSAKSSHSRSQLQPAGPPASDRVSEKPKPLLDARPFEVPQKYDARPQKPNKRKDGSRRRHSSSSSASSSSSSSSGSDSGSSSGSSSSGSSSSSSSSSEMSSDGRKPVKDQRRKGAKVIGKRFSGKSGRPEDEKEPGKEASRRKKEKDQLLPPEASHSKRSFDVKNKGSEMATGKDDRARSDISSERIRKKDLEKIGQSFGSESKKVLMSSLDQDKPKRDSHYGSKNSGESMHPKHGDAAEYSRKGRSPLLKDDRSKPLTPVDASRRGLSPVESQRSHHSGKPILPGADQDCDYEGQPSSGQYRDYYSGRDKTVRKEDDHFQQHPEEFYPKKHQDRGHARSQSYSSHKPHSGDPYERSQEVVVDHDREDRDGRYSRDHGYEGGHYPLSLDRHHTDIADESRSRQDYYSSSYERRSGRMDDSGRKDLERSEKHSSNYEPRESDRDFDAREHQKTRDQRSSDYKTRGDGAGAGGGEYSISSGMSKKAEESRRERTTQWVSERDPEDQSRQSGGRSDQRNYGDKRDGSRKRPLEDEGGTGRSPSAKKMREGSPSESHHSFSSRATYERDFDRLDKERGRSFKGRNVAREDDRYSGQAEGEYRVKGRDRGVEKEWEPSRRSDQKDSKERSKDSKVGMVEPRERGSETKESWHRDESSKRHRSPGDKFGLESWERGKDWKRPRTDLDTAEREKTVDRSSRRDEDYRGSPTRDRSPKSSGYGYKSERTDVDREKRASDSLAFVKSIEADPEGRGRLRSEEKRNLVTKDLESSVIPVHVDDNRMRRSHSRGSLGSKHSQRDREPRRGDDRQFEDRYDAGRDGHYRDERLPPPDRPPYDHEDRETWIKDRGYDRIRPEEDIARPYPLPFDYDRTERDIPKNRDFEAGWDMEPFRRDNLGFRGLSRAPNWERERPREEWENRYDRGPEQDYRARRDVLLPPPPRPRPVTEVRAPSPIPPPAETLVPPPVEHLPVRVEVKPEVVTPSKAPRPPKDEDTGYDDISDGELDDLIGVAEEDKEDSHVRKPGVVDILDIKWESLIRNNVEKPAVPRAVMNRFSANAVFRRIGVSRAFAGDDLWSQVKNFCQKQLDMESAVKTEEHSKEPEEKSSDLKVKDEIEKPVIKEEDNDGVSGVLDSETSVEQQPYASKTETVPKTEATPAKFELLDDLADFHAGLQLKSSERVGVVNNLGPYRRALSARRDLAIRRSLCKVDKEDILMFPTHVVDQDLYKQSLQLFHQDRTLEKKLPLNMSSTRLQASVASA